MKKAVESCASNKAPPPDGFSTDISSTAGIWSDLV